MDYKMAERLLGLVERLEAAVLSIETIVGVSPIQSVPDQPKPEEVKEVKAAKVEISPIVLLYDSSVLSKFTVINDFASKIDPQIVALVLFT
jgi:hypothetical protein